MTVERNWRPEPKKFWGEFLWRVCTTRVPLDFYDGTIRVPLDYYEGTTRVPLDYYEGTIRVPLDYYEGTTRVPLVYYEGTIRVPLDYYTAATSQSILVDMHDKSFICACVICLDD